MKNKVRAYNQQTLKEQFFIDVDSIPKGWKRGTIRNSKSKEGVEKTRLAHLGSRRNASTRQKMSDAYKTIRPPNPKCNKCGRFNWNPIIHKCKE